MNTQPHNPDLILGRLQTGTLVRHAWGDGHERASLLAALAPQYAEDQSFKVCPANMMPAWLAALTLMMDNGSKEAWEPMVRRYAAVAARWHRLDEDGWRRALLGSLTAILEIAREHDRYGSCETVIALCREGAAADDPRWKDAEAAARADVWEAAAWAAAADAADAEAAAAADAADAAVTAEVMGLLPRSRAINAHQAILEKAWDRVTDGILATIEAACDRAEEV